MLKKSMRCYGSSIAAICLLALSATAYADNASASPTFFPGADHSVNNYLGPTWQGQFTSPLSDTVANSFIIEAGALNQRLNETVGVDLSCNTRIKLSADLLRQDIDYDFASGSVRRWVRQGALGLGYQYHVNSPGFFQSFDMASYVSHAPSVDLDAATGSYTDSDGNTVDYTNYRRIAGSDARGVSPGVSFNLWQGGRLKAAVNYDNVHYDNRYQPKVVAAGFGETGEFSQDLIGDTTLDLLASDRAAFNNYRGGITWHKYYADGTLGLGVFGGYTVGKHQLPSTSIAGVNLSYTLGNACPAKSVSGNNTMPQQDLRSWTAKPAVYLPQVLAIADQKVITNVIPKAEECVAPTVSGDIPNQGQDNNPNINPIVLSSYFHGSNLTYSATGLIDDLTLDNGVISGPWPSRATSIRVTATNGCGEVQSNIFTISIPSRRS